MIADYAGYILHSWLCVFFLRGLLSYCGLEASLFSDKRLRKHRADCQRELGFFIKLLNLFAGSRIGILVGLSVSGILSDNGGWESPFYVFGEDSSC